MGKGNKPVKNDKKTMKPKSAKKAGLDVKKAPALPWDKDNDKM